MEKLTNQEFKTKILNKYDNLDDERKQKMNQISKTLICFWGFVIILFSVMMLLLPGIFFPDSGYDSADERTFAIILGIVFAIIGIGVCFYSKSLSKKRHFWISRLIWNYEKYPQVNEIYPKLSQEEKSMLLRQEKLARKYLFWIAIIVLSCIILFFVVDMIFPFTEKIVTQDDKTFLLLSDSFIIIFFLSLIPMTVYYFKKTINIKTDEEKIKSQIDIKKDYAGK